MSASRSIGATQGVAGSAATQGDAAASGANQGIAGTVAAQDNAAASGAKQGVAAQGDAAVSGANSVAGSGGSAAASSSASAGSSAGSTVAASAGNSATGGAAGAGGTEVAADGSKGGARACGAGATLGQDRKSVTAPAGTGRHATGSVDFKVKAGNRFLRLQTTLEVPAKPNGNSTLFMWPGLEPLENISTMFEPIGRGVLQPVLTWGGSCAPGSPAISRGKYWISAQYVNTLSTDSKYRGCYGGALMDTEINDKLYIDMRLKEGATIWTQTVTNLSNNKKVDFDYDLHGQDQNWALFEIEVASATLPSTDIIFTDTVLTLASPDPTACQPDSYGPNDYFSAPLISSNGTTCCIETIVLREEGVPATTTDP